MRRVLALLLCAGCAYAAENDARYREIARLINGNRHLSGHLVMAIDTRTIKTVRTKISEKDVPVLVRMLGDKDYGVASAASGLLVTIGKPALPAIEEAARSKNVSVASQARDALRLLDDCYNPALRDVMTPDVCPVGYR